MNSSGAVDVAIVGAGPYGLSLAAHLERAGVGFRIFGKPMQFWHDLPAGMFLKSFGFATNIYTPDGSHRFDDYCRERGLEHFEPCAMGDFARYGVWVQEQLIPRLEPADVTAVSRAGDGFQLTLANGEELIAKRVVVAVGVKHFASIPDELSALPAEFVSHTAWHSNYQVFAGKDVCVIGAGQSSFEAARLLQEAGANPQLLVREASISFSTKMPLQRPLWDRIRSPQSGLGPGLKSWAIEQVPILPHLLPDDWRVPFVKNHLGPSGAWWLKDRILGKVPVSLECAITHAEAAGGRLALRIADKNGPDRHLTCDHVVAGTGFTVDIDKLAFLGDELRREIRRLERAPALNARFRSSVPGLYFVGLASSLSFGPLFRFVAGAAFTSRTLRRELGREARARSAFVGRPVVARGA